MMAKYNEIKSGFKVLIKFENGSSIEGRIIELRQYGLECFMMGKRIIENEIVIYPWHTINKITLICEQD